MSNWKYEMGKILSTRYGKCGNIRSVRCSFHTCEVMQKPDWIEFQRELERKIIV